VLFDYGVNRSPLLIVSVQLPPKCNYISALHTKLLPLGQNRSIPVIFTLLLSRHSWESFDFILSLSRFYFATHSKRFATIECGWKMLKSDLVVGKHFYGCRKYSSSKRKIDTLVKHETDCLISACEATGGKWEVSLLSASGKIL